MLNGEMKMPPNGPGSVPTRSASTGQHPFSQNPNEELVELFSPVSEPSNVPPGIFDEQQQGGSGPSQPHIPSNGMRMMNPPSNQPPPPPPHSQGHGDMPMSPFPSQINRPMLPPQQMMFSGGPPNMGKSPFGPSMMGGSEMGGIPMPPPNMMAPIMPMPGPPGRVYPPNQAMVFNSNNPNAPPIYPCGICHKEIHDNDQAILCESGCNFWFHRTCAGLTEMAYILLTKEVYAEWVCDKCLATRNIPLVKMKS